MAAGIGLAALFLNQDESAIDKHKARTSGAFYHALLSGLISQDLVDPEHALSARDLTQGMARHRSFSLDKPSSRPQAQ